jgi:hypothetical protein
VLKLFTAGNMGSSEITLFTVSASQWYYVGWSWNKSDATNSRAFYATSLTGAVQQTSTFNITTSTMTPTILRCGDTVWGGEWWDGRIANLKLWEAQLTLAQIAAERWVMKPQRTADLYGWWPFMGGSDAERVRDYSGNGNDFTVGGTLTDEAAPPIPWGTYSIWIPDLGAAGPATLSVSVSDSVSVAESVVLDVSDPQVVVQDTANVAENVSALIIGLALDVSVSDTVTVAEAHEEEFEFEVVESDTVTVAENEDILSVSLVSGSDTVTVAEAHEEEFEFEVVESDTVTVAENIDVSISAASTRTISVSDTVAVAEAHEEELITVVSVFENVSTAENTNIHIITPLAPIDLIMSPDNLDVWKRGVQIYTPGLSYSG